MKQNKDLGLYVKLLEEDPDYRVLRRFQPCTKYSECPPGHPVKIGLYVDVETTGLDTDNDKIIEFGAVKFTFDEDGNIFDVIDELESLEDPGIPIQEEASKKHGLYAEDVAGKKIDDVKVSKLLESVSLIISYKAEFDRKLLEQRFTGFDRIPWACSFKEVPWEQEFGSIGAKMGNALAVCRRFYDGHRALIDCQAGVYLLAHAKQADRSAFSYLLEASQKFTYLIPALDPFPKKGRLLNSRGYRWNWEAGIHCREVEPLDIPNEIQWLEKNVCQWKLPREGFPKITAFERYSVRPDALLSKWKVDQEGAPFMKFIEGINQIRIFSGPIHGWACWSASSKKHTYYRKQEYHGMTLFTAFIVWDYSDSLVKILPITQKSVRTPMFKLFEDPKWKDPRLYDIEIERKTGSAKNDCPQFSVRCCPQTLITEEQARAFSNADYDLEAIVFKDPKLPSDREQISVEEQKE